MFESVYLEWRKCAPRGFTGWADAAMYTAKRSGPGGVFAGNAAVSVVATASPPPTSAQKF